MCWVSMMESFSEWNEECNQVAVELLIFPYYHFPYYELIA